MLAVASQRGLRGEKAQHRARGRAKCEKREIWTPASAILFW